MKRHPNFTLRLDEVSMKKLKYIAAGNDRSVNGEIANIIHVYIASFERKYGSIEPPEKNGEEARLPARAQRAMRG